MKAQSELEKMLDDLLELDDGLSDWEVEFLESLHKWRGRNLPFTAKQAAKLEQIARQKL